MRYETTRSAVFVTTIVWLALFAVGCGSSSDERVLTFYALGPSDTIGSAERTIAVGSVLELSVVGEGGEVDIAEASIAPEGVFEIISAENPVAVRALAAGSADLRVVTDDGTSDSITLRAEVPDSIEVSVSPDFGLFSTWISAPLPDDQTSAGIVLLPGTSVLLRASLFDADYERMLGYYGGADWSASVEGVVEMSFALERQEVVRISPLEEASGVTTIAVAGEQVLSVEVTPSAVADQLVVTAGDAPLTSLDHQVGADGVGFDDTMNVFVLPLDDRGRTLFGNGVGAEVSGDGGVVEVSTLDPQIVVVRALAIGETTIRVEQLGATLEMPVRIHQ